MVHLPPQPCVGGAYAARLDGDPDRGYGVRTFLTSAPCWVLKHAGWAIASIGSKPASLLLPLFPMPRVRDLLLC